MNIIALLLLLVAGCLVIKGIFDPHLFIPHVIFFYLLTFLFCIPLINNFLLTWPVRGEPLYASAHLKDIVSYAVFAGLVIICEYFEDRQDHKIPLLTISTTIASFAFLFL